MYKKKPSSDSPYNEPQPSAAVDQPSQQPPTAANEPVGPEIIQAIIQAVDSMNRGEREEALNFIKESISCHPLSGQLHYTEGRIHLRLAYNAGTGDDGAIVKHLEDGVRAVQLAVELLPNSLHCARLLVDLLYELAFSNKEWERVEEACDRGLRIQNPVDFGVRDLFVDDLYDQARFEENMKWLEEVERLQNLQLLVKKTVEGANEENKEEEDGEADTNHLVMTKKQIMNKLKDNNDDILKHKCFWNMRLSDEKKRGFRKVNIEELESHFKLLKDQVAVDLLWEAIDFAKQHKTWKFWECCSCVKKFVDYGLYKKHFWEAHWMGRHNYWILSEEIVQESIDIILHGVWKAVEINEAIRVLVNPVKSEKDLDECKSLSVEEVPGKISKSDDNELLETSMNGPKWEFCDDIERSEILGRIRSLFHLLYRNRCLPPTLVHWVVEYTDNQFECKIPLAQYMGVRALQSVCFLGASQLTEVLQFLKNVVRTCGLSENVEMDNSMDDKNSDHHLFGIKERVLFSRDLSCLLLDERVLLGKLNASNYFEAVAGDGSAASFSDSDKCEDDVLADNDNIVPWLYMGYNCEEVLESWTRLRESRGRQAENSYRACLKKVSVLPRFCAGHEEIPDKEKAVSKIESMFLDETEKREKSPGYEPQLYIDLLRKRQTKLQESNENNSSVKNEIFVISEVLKEAQEVLSRDQECAKQKDICIKKALRSWKLRMIKDMAFHDAVVFRKVAAFTQYERELTSISVCDYRLILVPMLKTFLQSNLKDLYEDANEKAKAAAEALLALEAENNISKDSDDVEQNQDKKKKKKKKKKKNKNKNPETSKDEEQTNEDEKQTNEMRLQDAERKKRDDQLSNEAKKLSLADAVQKLDEHLEYQRRFEHEASLKANAARSGNEGGDSRE